MYKRIRELREDHDMRQSDIAQKLYMQLTQYRRYENGEREPPFDVIIRIAELYNVSLDYIAGRTEQPENPNIK